MNQIFDWCVRLLENWALYFGTTYKAINVWIFVIIEPAIFLLMLVVILRQGARLRNMKRKMSKIHQ